jgi:hypothetical protein
MAIQRYIGDTFIGLSSDTKPANILDGARFFESDTLKIFLKVTGSWVIIGGAGSSNTFTDTADIDFTTVGSVINAITKGYAGDLFDADGLPFNLYDSAGNKLTVSNGLIKLGGLLFEFTTDSESPVWSPEDIGKTGIDSLFWEVTGACTYIDTLVKPIFDFSNPGEKRVKVYCSDSRSTLSYIRFNTDQEIKTLRLEYTPGLGNLSVQGSSVVDLDLGDNTSLTGLELQDANLTSLDIALLSDLIYLNLLGSTLPEIDLSNNTELITFYGGNYFSFIDFSNNNNISDLEIYNENGFISSFDISNLIQLTNLTISNLRYSGMTLDISTAPLLVFLDVTFTLLSDIDLSNNPDLTHVVVSHNEILADQENTMLDVLYGFGVSGIIFDGRSQFPSIYPYAGGYPDESKATLLATLWTEVLIEYP